MASSLNKIVVATRDAIDRHGGGWSGLLVVMRKSYRLLCALGIKGLLRRLRGAAARTSPPPPPVPPSKVAFPQPLPVEALTLKAGVMAHIFYPDLIGEFAEYLEHIPVDFVLMVSVMDGAAKRQVEDRFSRLNRISELYVRIVPNRGRDMAPLLLTFRDEILALDLICHIHTKKSLYTGAEQETWRHYLLQSLLGSQTRVTEILGLFQAMPTLGMLYPESFRAVSLAAHTWLSNAELARELGERLNVSVDPTAYLDFPAGSMFWARVDAVRPLFELGLTLSDFPEERGQNDGTLQHVIERMLAQVVRQGQRQLGILPANGEFVPYPEGERNWDLAFQIPVAEQIETRSIDANVVSFDVFDTLVTRSFLTPQGSLTYLEHRVEKIFGLKGFADLRQRAESRARARSSRDIDLQDIYNTLTEFPQVSGLDVAALQRCELDFERQQIRAREDVSTSAARLANRGKHVIAVSDMYLGEAMLRDVLPASISGVMNDFYVSCDTGWRKDTGDAWRQLPTEIDSHAGTWLHVGDNEHSDKQLPHDLGFLPPVHVLRPSSLLETVPVLRPLRPAPKQAAKWPNQLWLGLVANRFTRLADRAPHTFSHVAQLDDARDVGYVVFGPLVLDYLTWMSRLALVQRVDKILFLSREGYLLNRAFKALQVFTPKLSVLEPIYLLASRRGIGTATIRGIDEIRHLIDGTFNGSLLQLVASRMGREIAEIVALTLGSQTVGKEVFLPEMKEAVAAMIEPALPGILGRASEERAAYLAYWTQQVGDSRVILSDVGYSGTIQTHLGRLTEQTLLGAYFALNARANQTSLHSGQAFARFHDARLATAGASAILDHDLLLESVLTSPEPQFSHFKLDRSGLRPQYAHETAHQRSFANLSQIHQGVEDFIRDVGNVVGADALQMEFDPELVQQPLHCLGTGLWRGGIWQHDLLVDDHYTGRGNIAVGDRTQTI